VNGELSPRARSDASLSGPAVTGYPPTGGWFYPRPAWRGEARLHRVRGYHVDGVERELLVDADCGLSLTATAAVDVPDLGDGDLRCGRCRTVGRVPSRVSRPRPRRRLRRVIGRVGQGSQ